MSKVGKPELEAEILKAIEEAKKPVTVMWLVEKVNASYPTVRVQLLDMVLKGKLQKIETTANDLFLLPQTNPAFLGQNKQGETDGE